MSTNDQADAGHRTANRVLDILERLADAPRGSALRDLSQDLDAPKSSLLPLLRTLTARGYAIRDVAGSYRLGAKVLELGSTSLADMDLREIARPALVRLTEHCGESTILATMTSDHMSVIYIDKVEGTHRIRVAAAVGELRPLHSTASGKVLLAYLPAPERDTVIRNLKLVRYTEKTITTKVELRAELERVRRDGISINMDQSVMGHCAIAAPIFNHQGIVVAACVLSAPKDRVKARLPQLAGEVRATANAISSMIGYRARGD